MAARPSPFSKRHAHRARHPRSDKFSKNCKQSLLAEAAVPKVQTQCTTASSQGQAWGRNPGLVRGG